MNDKQDELLAPEEIIARFLYKIYGRCGGLDWDYLWEGADLKYKCREQAKELSAQLAKVQKARPDREKIAKQICKIKYPLLSWEVISTEQKEYCYKGADQILAIISDIEECNQLCCDFIADQANREERERIFREVEEVSTVNGEGVATTRVILEYKWKALQGEK